MITNIQLNYYHYYQTVKMYRSLKYTRARENKKKDRKIEELCTRVFVLLCFGYCVINTFMLRIIFNVYYFGKSELWNLELVMAYLSFNLQPDDRQGRILGSL